LCYIGSTVGYDVHRRAWADLQKLENSSMNSKIDSLSLSIDNWLPGLSADYKYRCPVHYLIPGVLHQRVPKGSPKKQHDKAMEGFSSNCATPYDHRFSGNTSTGHLAVKTWAPEKRIRKKRTEKGKTSGEKGQKYGMQNRKL